MDTQLQQFGGLSFLVNMLLTAKTDDVTDFYSQLSKSEKQLLFDKNKVSSEKARLLEISIKRKVKKLEHGRR